MASAEPSGAELTVTRSAQAPLRLETLEACRLVIGRYPGFLYDGRGGGGLGCTDQNSGALLFPPGQLTIPPLNSSTTRFLGLPLPPGVAIAIEAQELQGCWDPTQGDVRLAFRARFRFRIAVGSATLYRAPDLLIACQLSSGEAIGRRHRACGSTLNAAGEGQLVGVAQVAPSGDALLDRFLGLPDEALAVLRCRISGAAG